MVKLIDMKDPLISVITCTKNREDFVDLSLNSVGIQTYKNIEHIIVDGESTDGTLKKIHQYMERNPERNIRLVSAPPNGISNAMNIGIDNASGDIIHFLHSDDYYLEKDTLQKVADLFGKNETAEWIVGNVVLEIKGQIVVLPYNEVLKRQFKTLMSLYNWVPHENTFVKKDIFTKYGKFSEDLKNIMDYEFWIRIMKSETPVFVNESFTVFVIHNDSATCNPKNWTNTIKEFVETWKQARSIPLIGYVDENGIYKNSVKLKEVMAEKVDNIFKSLE